MVAYSSHLDFDLLGYLARRPSVVYWSVVSDVDPVPRELSHYLQAQDMNDKGKRKATAAASSSSKAAIDDFSPITVLSETLRMLSENKGKSKQQDETLSGNFPSISWYSLANLPCARMFQLYTLPDM